MQTDRVTYCIQSVHSPAYDDALYRPNLLIAFIQTAIIQRRRPQSTAGLLCCKGATTGEVGGPDPPKFGRTTPTFYVAVDCSARNWLYHPYFGVSRSQTRHVRDPPRPASLGGGGRQCRLAGTPHVRHGSLLTFWRFTNRIIIIIIIILSCTIT